MKTYIPTFEQYLNEEWYKSRDGKTLAIVAPYTIPEIKKAYSMYVDDDAPEVEAVKIDYYLDEKGNVDSIFDQLIFVGGDTEQLGNMSDPLNLKNEKDIMRFIKKHKIDKFKSSNYKYYMGEALNQSYIKGKSNELIMTELWFLIDDATGKYKKALNSVEDFLKKYRIGSQVYEISPIANFTSANKKERDTYDKLISMDVRAVIMLNFRTDSMNMFNAAGIWVKEDGEILVENTFVRKDDFILFPMPSSKAIKTDFRNFEKDISEVIPQNFH